MRIISEVPSQRETVIAFSDREIRIIDACLSKIDDDYSFKGLYELYSNMSDVREDKLSLDFLSLDDEE